VEQLSQKAYLLFFQKTWVPKTMSARQKLKKSL